MEETWDTNKPDKSILAALKPLADKWEVKGFTLYDKCLGGWRMTRLLREDELLDADELLDSLPRIGVWVKAVEGETTSGKPIRFYVNTKQMIAAALRFSLFDQVVEEEDVLVFLFATKQTDMYFANLVEFSLRRARRYSHLICNDDAILAGFRLAHSDDVSSSDSRTNRLL